MPVKSFDAPISSLTNHKASGAPSDDVWGELASEDVEGMQDSSLLSKLGHGCVSDLLQQDLNQLLNTLQPRERNVSAC